MIVHAQSSSQMTPESPWRSLPLGLPDEPPGQLTATALLALSGVASAASAPHWVASWQASPQPVWDADFLFPTLVPAALQDQTFRQTARISLGGSRLRVRLSNAYGTQPLRIRAASVAAGAGATRNRSASTASLGC